MEQIKNYLPMILLCLLVTKCIIIGADYSDMGISLGLIGYLSLISYIEKHKKIQDFDAVIKKQTEVSLHLLEELDKLKSSIAGAKLSAGMTKKF